MKVNMIAAFRLYRKRDDGSLKPINYIDGYTLSTGRFVFRVDGVSTLFEVNSIDILTSYRKTIDARDNNLFEDGNNIWVMETGYEFVNKNKKYVDSFDIKDETLSKVHLMRKQLTAGFIASMDKIKEFEIFIHYPTMDEKKEKIPVIVELCSLTFEYRTSLKGRKTYNVDKDVLRDFNIRVSKINSI